MPLNDGGVFADFDFSAPLRCLRLGISYVGEEQPQPFALFTHRGFPRQDIKIIMWRVSSIKRSSARMLCPPTKSSAFIFGTSRSDLKGGKPVAGDQSGIDDQAQRLRVNHLRLR